ncbi:hypothetical protein Avbf_12813 [Armadillidium vulgare]|nr:hypothetical protein Avbf_12813 [Armadillidium vulgare]
MQSPRNTRIISTIDHQTLGTQVLNGYSDRPSRVQANDRVSGYYIPIEILGFEHVEPPKAGNSMYSEYVDSYEFLKDRDDPDELRRNQWKTRIHEQVVSLSSKSTPHSRALTSDEREKIAKCRSISRSNPALLGTTELECKQRKTHRRSLSLVSHVPESRKSVRGIAQPRSVREQYSEESNPDKSDDIISHDRRRSVNPQGQRQCLSPKERLPGSEDMHGGRQKQRCSAERIHEQSQIGSERNPQLIDLSLNIKKDRTQSIEIEVVKPQELSLISENNYCLEGKGKRIPNKVVKSQELSLISENDHRLKGKEKRIPKKVVRPQELSLISENEHSVQSTEQTRDIPAGSRNLFEVTLSDMGKKSPREGQLLVAEVNNKVREDEDMYVRRERSHVEKEKILIKRSNLDGKSVKLRPSNARGRSRKNERDRERTHQDQYRIHRCISTICIENM